jgi:molecular chaperone DnaJ
MAGKDYYKILGVEKGSSEAEIKSAFRQAARKFHPDVYKGADREDKFKEINEAYQVLGDPNKKSQYDQFGSVDGFDFNSAQAGANGFGDIFSNFGDMFEGFGFEGFGDVFGSSRRGSSRSSAKARGEDLRVDTTITLEEAASGVEKVISVRKFDKCDKCNGSGSSDGKPPENCPTCGGRGEVRQTRQSFLGMVSTVSICPTCQGEGKVIKTPCNVCSGSGRAVKNKEISVKIPAGINDGSKLRVSGEGNIGQRNGAKGDLYIFINIKKHNVFERENDDLFMKTFVSYPQAVLGATVDVKTLFGTVSIKIPPGTQPNTSFRLKGKGMPHLGGSGHGDLYVSINIAVPKDVSGDEKMILEYLANIKGEKTDISKKFTNIKEKIKKIF